MHFVSNEDKDKWIEDYVERATDVARKRVEDPETAIKQEQDDMRNAEKAGLTTAKPETTFQEMLNAIENGLGDLASSDIGEDGEDEDDDEEDPAGGKLREDDQPTWVMGTISKMVQYRKKCFQRKQMELDKLMPPGWGDAANYYHGRDKKYGTTEWKVLAVVQPQMAYDAASSLPRTFGEPIDTLYSIPRKLQMPQVTSGPGSGHMRLRSLELQTHKRILSFPPTPTPNWSQSQTLKHVESITFDPCISHPKLITE